MEEGHKEGDYYSINEHEAMNIRGGTTCGRRGQHSILKILMQIFAAAFAQPQEDTMDNDTVDDDANEDAANDDEDTNDTAAAATAKCHTTNDFYGCSVINERSSHHLRC